MKKNVLALAIASSVAAPAAMADAPVLYGKLHLAVEQLDTAIGNDTSINSHDSRLGVKGSQDLGDGLTGIYQVEFALNKVADDDSDTLSQRNTYLGLKGDFGQVILGTHDMPTKMIQPKDLFGDSLADVKYFTNGLENGENRQHDMAMYTSPSFDGFKVIAAAVVDEAGQPDADHSSNWNNIAVTYGSTKEGLYLSGAWQDATDIDMTLFRVSAQYLMADIIASVMYQDNSGNDAKEGNYTQVQFGYKMGKFMPKFKFVTATNDTADSTENGYAAGFDYKLSKKMSAYVYTAKRKDVSAGKYDDVNFSVGLIAKF